MNKLSRKRHPQPLATSTPTPINPGIDDDEDFKNISPYSKLTPVENPTESELLVMKETSVVLLDDIDLATDSPIISSHYFSSKKDKPVKDVINSEIQSKPKGTKSKKQPADQIPKEKETPKEEEIVKEEDPPENEEIAFNPNPKDKVVCPFCWKKLNDKLTGTSHVKNCGKDLPTERIFEALQLHEKQIREWEYLGIAYPGFQQNPAGKTGGAASTKPTASRKGRKKKDPELDLALALSASLHEEIENRKQKENEYLVEIGLEKEIKVLPPSNPPEENEAKQSYRVRLGKEPKTKTAATTTAAKQPSLIPGQLTLDQGPINRRRGGNAKTKLIETPLYKVTNEQRQVQVGTKVAEILENSEKENERRYRLYEINLPEGVNQRLEPYHDVESSLWKLACGEKQSEENFYTRALQVSNLRQILQENKQKVMEIPAVSTKKTEKSDIVKELMSAEGKSASKPNSNSIKKFETKSVKITTGRPSENFSFSSTPLDPDMSVVAQDLLKLFIHKIDADLTFYGTEEIPIRAHKLIVTARCPKLLPEIIVEESNGKRNEIIPLTSFSHAAVKSLVWFLYSGQFLPLTLSAEDLKVEEELSELCQLYNLPLPNAGVQNPKNRPIINEPLKLIIPDCTYVEKSVQTDELMKSPLPSPLELSTPNWHFENLEENHEDEQELEFPVYDSDDTDAVVVVPPKADVEDVIPEPSIEGEKSNDGSCDLFKEYFQDEKSVEIVDPIPSPSGSFKKRCRSLSPSLERSFDKATKKHKLSLEDEELGFDRVESSSVIVLDDECVMDSEDIPYDAYDDFDNRLPEPDYADSFQKDATLTNFDSDSTIRPSIPTNNFLLNHDSPISRRSFSSQISSNRSRRNLLTKSQSFEKFRTSPSTPMPHSRLFPPDSTPVNRSSSPPFQANGFAWDNDDESILSKIPDDLLDIPSNPFPFPTSSPESLTVATKKKGEKSKTKGKRDSGKNENEGKGAKVKSKKPTAVVKLPGLNCLNKQSSSLANKQSDLNVETATPPSRASSSQQPTRTPLLNYSTIDTPILKGELKKYGLKPLPRSKAKLLLRHIYTETHK